MIPPSPSRRSPASLPFVLDFFFFLLRLVFIVFAVIIVWITLLIPLVVLIPLQINDFHKRTLLPPRVSSSSQKDPEFHLKALSPTINHSPIPPYPLAIKVIHRPPSSRRSSTPSNFRDSFSSSRGKTQRSSCTNRNSSSRSYHSYSAHTESLVCKVCVGTCEMSGRGHVKGGESGSSSRGTTTRRSIGGWSRIERGRGRGG